ncbi:MAG: redoxin domain-containing protein [Phycisphaerales bacterium]|nr:redoxin domain-containing protein [Phycisphaerales bacterium]
MVLATLLGVSPIVAQEQPKPIYIGQFAPDFKIKDINGVEQSIERYKGKKILLSFYRYASCPICNFRFHELEAERAFFEQKGVVFLAVYESSADNVKDLNDTNQYYQILIPNPNGALYELYAVEISKGKVLKGMTNGAIRKANEGKKLFAKKIKKDGNSNRIAADFLIDENGNVIYPYYGRYLGDRMPIEFIKSHL